MHKQCGLAIGAFKRLIHQQMILDGGACAALCWLSAATAPRS
jgi:hypothetical protein